MALRDEVQCVEKKNSAVYIDLAAGLQEKFKCPLCEQLLKEPIQTIRGELACEICYRSHQRVNPSICPIDKEPISHGEFFRDRFRSIEIRNLQCFCAYKKHGCPWKGVVADVEEHQSKCHYPPDNCCFCDEPIQSGKNMLEHLTDCGSLNKNACLYTKCGCNYQPENIHEYIIHLKEDAVIHCLMQHKRFEDQQHKATAIHNEAQTIRNVLEQNKVKTKEDIKNLQDQISIVTNATNETQEKLEKIQKGMAENHFKEKCTQLNITSNEGALGTVSTVQLSSNVDAIDRKISDLDLKQQIHENTTFNGRFLWKIDNFKHRMQQAVIGRVTALHSAPCFTGKYQYKLCGRLYLNGDGMGKCTHLSLFIVIMRSEFDNLLTWPFTKRIVFRLINQEDTTKYIEESFTPDPSSASFQKPQKDMNIAAGCPMFISKDDLLSGGYVNDDSIFIEINVI